MSQDRVGVHAHHGSQVACRPKSFAGFGFSVGDCAADLRGSLVVQQGRV
jgi:hypothetical protein